jgi:hypothetical protein
MNYDLRFLPGDRGKIGHFRTELTESSYYFFFKPLNAASVAE